MMFTRLKCTVHAKCLIILTLYFHLVVTSNNDFISLHASYQLVGAIFANN